MQLRKRGILSPIASCSLWWRRRESNPRPQSVTELSLNWTRTTVPASTSLPGFSDCEIARTLAELPPVAPETLIISPASVSLRLAAAAVSPTTFGTTHNSVDFSASR